ncbi:MAG: hypothetical protein WCQ91_08525, partial [Planctomycetota bacterium]
AAAMGRSHGGAQTDAIARFVGIERKGAQHLYGKAFHTGGPLALCHLGHQTSRAVYFIVIFTPTLDVAAAGKACRSSELRKWVV